MPLDAPTREPVREITLRLKAKAGPLLPILHAVQDALGYVPPEAGPVIAEGLNLSRAEAHGVISFYHYFRETAPGHNTIHLCRAESCQSMQSRALEAHAKERLGVAFQGGGAHRGFSFLPGHCLGHCA